MGRRSCAQLLALCCHLITLFSRVDCFVGPLARLPVSTGRVSQISARRCRIPRLSSFKRGRSAGSALAAAAEGEETGTGLGLEAESKRRRITRAPLRITPNFEPRDKRKSNADAESDVPYGVFLTEESLVIAGEDLTLSFLDCGRVPRRLFSFLSDTMAKHYSHKQPVQVCTYLSSTCTYFVPKSSH